MVNRATNEPRRRLPHGPEPPAPEPGRPENPLYSHLRERRSRPHSRLLDRGEFQLLPRRLSRRLHLPPFIELFDVRFFRMKKNYLGQAALATVVILAVLILVDSVADAVLAAGLGSSAVILFVHPNSRSAALRHLIGGHLHGLLIGMAASLLLFHSGPLPVPPHLSGWVADIVAAGTLGVVILVMAVTDTEHPPAAATALGFALESLELTVIVIFAGGVLLLAFSKLLFRSALRDLD